MIRSRHATVAILFKENKALLMKRGEHREIAPGYWSGIGGHFEEHEMNTPYEACFREIEEESGIIREHILNLKLLYILLRRFRDEIRYSYIFFGESTKKEVIQTDEGELFWIPKEEFMDRQFTDTFTLMFKHYMKREAGDSAVYVGTIENNNGKARMIWARCEDFEI